MKADNRATCRTLYSRCPKHDYSTPHTVEALYRLCSGCKAATRLSRLNCLGITNRKLPVKYAPWWMDRYHNGMMSYQKVGGHNGMLQRGDCAACCGEQLRIWNTAAAAWLPAQEAA